MSDDSDPAINAIVITPDDSTLITAPRVRGIYVGGAGNVTALMAVGTVVTFTNVPSGTILPISVKRINSTGTTATDILGLI